MWPSTNVTMNSKFKKNADVTGEGDLSSLVAAATAASNKPKHLSPTSSTTASLRPFEMRKNYQQKHKTSAEIISETKNMFAGGKFILILVFFFFLDKN